jgi:hypothetical protein
MSLRPTSPHTRPYRLYNEISWKSSLEMKQTTECTYRQFPEPSWPPTRDTRAISSCKLQCPAAECLRKVADNDREAIESLMADGMLFSTIDDLVSLPYSSTVQ